MKSHKGSMVDKAHMGQKIVTDTGPDRSSHMVDKSEALGGRPMKGGVNDVSSSLTGAGQVNTYNDKPASRR